MSSDQSLTLPLNSYEILQILYLADFFTNWPSVAVAELGIKGPLEYLQV